MIRIVGLNRSPDVRHEFVLLQNQGAMRVALRGHAVLAESLLDGRDQGAMHLFAEDEVVPAGKFVLLFTGPGEPRWARTRDGQLVYHAYMGRREAVWQGVEGAIQLLQPQHRYIDRPAADFALA